MANKLHLLMRKSLIFALLVTMSSAMAQERMLIDKVIAKVGTETILLSDVESQYSYASEQAGYADPAVKCQVMQSLIGQKLIVHHAKLDSIEVLDEEIESNLDYRIDQVLRQMNGDEEFFEEYYGMPVKEMRENLREDLQQQMLAERMQMKILNEVSITPKEVKKFYNSIPVDSIPYLNAEVELKELVVKPEVNDVERAASLSKIVKLRNQIINKEAEFEELARKFSDDPGSGAQGGNLGYAERGTFVPEFEATAYSLEKGEVSEPIETEFGFHILQLLDRRGNKINIRHILIKPEITSADLDLAKSKLDTLKAQIEREEITFSEAIKKHGYEKVPSYNNNGFLQNPNTGKTLFQTSELPSEIYFATEDTEVGEMTSPLEYPFPTGETYYRIIKLISKSKPHKASLEEDYAKIQLYAKESKKNEYFSNWLEEKFQNTFIKIESGYLACPDLDELING